MSRFARPISSTIVKTLVAAGVNLQIWHLPAELFEVMTGPVVSYDDIIDFHFQLEDVDWFYEQLYSCQQTSNEIIRQQL